MQAIRPAHVSSKLEYPQSVSIQTTLFDLISARQAEMEPGEEGLIIDEVTHLLQSGRITCSGDPEPWTEMVADVAAWTQKDELAYPDGDTETGVFQFEPAGVSSF